MHLSIIQTDIAWEDKAENLRLLRHKLQALRGGTELVVLPEMFSTGFSMRAEALAEPFGGATISTLRQWAAEFGLALCGSYIASEGGKHYNRGFFLTPEGEAWQYDKRHLFRMGEEPRHFSPGDRRLVLTYRGWNICLLVCYDLRFPVWSRNVDNAYDLLVYPANWPASRRAVWDTLLRARALENQCYVAGVNRVGTDGMGLRYDGGSRVVSPYGKDLATVPDGEEGLATATLSLDGLRQFREKFPVWRDADLFSLQRPDPTNIS
ncbi:MAG: amidohydrolase [Mediterranea sp.]|jgi:predicted amidohydrolase|nr:amidohydrolase [Mediterranea sp.]